MTFTETPLAGAFVIDIERRADDRGFFARSWCDREFADHGLSTVIKQANVSFNVKRGTLRGMHFQLAPHEEVKVVRCTRGSLVDVIIDLRPGSATYGKWFAVELTADNHRMLYIPEQFAHGYQTLEDNTDLMYLVSKPYAPTHASGVRYNDPAFGITWPLPVSMISPADAGWPLLVPGGARPF